MKKNTKRMLTMAVVAGVGTASWMYMKKKYPDAIDEMKNMSKDAACNMLLKLEDMD